MSESQSHPSASPDLKIIAVEGPIGVGKTTLARRLANAYGTDLVLEAVAENPFLEKFYADPQRFALATQIQFLFQRVDQLQHYRQDDLFQTIYVTDYMLEKDRLFAEINLDPQEYELYDTIYRRIVVDVPSPDLVIYLHAPVSVLLQRIARRGRAYEASITESYLERLCAAYVVFFRDYASAPVMFVDTTRINFADSDTAFTQLLARLGEGVYQSDHFGDAFEFD